MIRKADLSDVRSLREMALVVFPHTYKTILSPEQLDYMLEWMYSEPTLEKQISEGTVYFIEEGKGYCSVRFDSIASDGTRIYHLDKIYVLPDFQHSGLGKQLFTTALDYVREHSSGKTLIELNVNRNNPSVHFYEKMGMKKLRSGDFPIGNDYFMEDYIMGLYL